MDERHLRLLLLLPILGGCFDIHEAGGRWEPIYETELVSHLRPDSNVLYDLSSGFGRDSVLVGWREADGAVRARVDPFRHDADFAWGGLINPHAIELFAVDGALTVAGDQSHYDMLHAFDNGTYGNRLFCNKVVQLWSSTETPTGWESSSLDLGDPALCTSPALLGPGPGGDQIALLLDGSFEVVGLSVVDDVLAFDRQPLPGLTIPSEPLWIGAPAIDQVELIGRDESGAWVHVGSTGTRTASGVTGIPLGIDPVIQVDAQTFELRTGDGVWSWQPGATPTQLDTWPAPTIGATWERGSWPGGALAVERGPHPLSEPVDAEVAAQALIDDGSGVTLVDIPLTPCSDAAECDALGTFTVIGLYRGPQRIHVVYDFLSWWYGSGQGKDGDDVDAVLMAPL